MRTAPARLLSLSGLALGVALSGCSCGTSASPDASTDAGRLGDARVGPDAGPEPVDAPRPLDGGADASSDAGPVRWEITIVAPPAGLPFGVPLGMSERGEVVGYAGPEAWSPVAQPLRIEPASSTATLLPTPALEMSFAYDVDQAGALVGGMYQQQPYAWVDGVGHLVAVPSGFFSGAVHAVGADGRLVGSWADADDALPPSPIGPRPCTWPRWDAPAVPLPTSVIELPLGAAWAVSETGAIAGTVATSGGFRACRWDTPTSFPTLLGSPPGATLSEARAIDLHGDVAGRVTIDGAGHAFVELGASGTTLLTPLATGAYAEAFGMNDAHWVVGTSGAGDGTVHAVLWDVAAGGVAIDLNDRVTLPSGVRYLSSAVAVSNARVIAAEAVMESGLGDSERHVAILRPIP